MLTFDVRITAPLALVDHDTTLEAITEDAAIELARELLRQPRVELVTIEAHVPRRIDTFAIRHFRFGEPSSSSWSTWELGAFKGTRPNLDGWPEPWVRGKIERLEQHR